MILYLKTYLKKTANCDFIPVDRESFEILLETFLLEKAIYELKYHPEVPGKVVINEAIELGKKYSTKESAGFLNGILDNVFKQELNRNE